MKTLTDGDLVTCGWTKMGEDEWENSFAGETTMTREDAVEFERQRRSRIGRLPRHTNTGEGHCYF